MYVNRIIELFLFEDGFRQGRSDDRRHPHPFVLPRLRVRRRKRPRSLRLRRHGHDGTTRQEIREKQEIPTRIITIGSVIYFKRFGIF